MTQGGVIGDDNATAGVDVDIEMQEEHKLAREMVRKEQQ